MRLAFEMASRSKDPNTQVGAVIVDRHNHILSTGYNGFPQGIQETPDLWQRPHKYDRVIHAETNAIAQAARRGVSLVESTIFTTHLPCLNCCKTIIAAGITRVVANGLIRGWDAEHEKACVLFNESSIRWEITQNVRKDKVS
jgi:dCMP deaminase